MPSHASLNSNSTRTVSPSQPVLHESEQTDVSLNSGRQVSIFSHQNAQIIGERASLATTSTGEVLPLSHLFPQNFEYDLKLLIKEGALQAPLKGKIEGSALFLSCGGAAENYYHWMHDCLPRLLAAERLNESFKVIVPS